MEKLRLFRHTEGVYCTPEVQGKEAIDGPTLFSTKGRVRMPPIEPTVYLVEDDDDMRQSLTWLLHSHDFQVEAFARPSTFLESYDPSHPGCLLLDLRLPEMTGLELQREVDGRGGRHPFVFISAHGTFDSAVEALREGAVDFLAKPFDHAQLIDRVRIAIDRDVRERAIRRQREQIKYRVDSLSPREQQILDDVVQGKLSKEIAAKLGIKQKTVEVHRSNMVRKMKAGSVAQLVRMVAVLREPGELIDESIIN